MLKKEVFENYTLFENGNIINLKTGDVLNVYSRNGKKKVDYQNKSYDLDRLLAEAFIPNPHGYKLLRHLDGNYRNNVLSNLYWGFEEIKFEIEDLYDILPSGQIIKKETGQEMKYHYDKKGIKRVSLNLGNHNHKIYQVNSLIANRYLPKPYPEVRHVKYKDGNPSNVNVENLEWHTKPLKTEIVVKEVMVKDTRVFNYLGKLMNIDEVIEMLLNMGIISEKK